jgi:hypothetical protein
MSNLPLQQHPQEGTTLMGDSSHTDLSDRRSLVGEAKRHLFGKGGRLLLVKSSAVQIVSRLPVHARGRGYPRGDPGKGQMSTVMTWPLNLDATTDSLPFRRCER